MKINFISIKNDIFNPRPPAWTACKSNSQPINTCSDEAELVKALRESKDIFEKQYGDISSFNFKRDVFYSGKWNDLSKFARGLFINTHTNKIVARGYEKFFNYNETPFNTPVWLKENIIFPVKVWNKYNGFLGLLGVDDTRAVGDKLVFCSKSAPDSEYANWFKEIFFRKFKHSIIEFEEYLNKETLCLIFEVIDPVNDPHIIEYDRVHIILLAAIKRTISFEELSYSNLVKFANNYNFNVKSLYSYIYSFTELEDFIDKISNNFVTPIEGFVLEDTNKYMFKLKGGYYKRWKHLRQVKDTLSKGRSLKMGWAQSPEENYFVDWCKKQDKLFLETSSIIQLRNIFLSQK